MSKDNRNHRRVCAVCGKTFPAKELMAGTAVRPALTEEIRRVYPRQRTRRVDTGCVDENRRRNSDAMGTGTDVTMQSAGITVARGDVRGIAKEIRLGRVTMRDIRQNLFFAFLYNVLGIPVTAGVPYSFVGLPLIPIIAVAATSLRSVTVISIALRLRRTRL